MRNETKNLKQESRNIDGSERAGQLAGRVDVFAGQRRPWRRRGACWRCGRVTRGPDWDGKSRKWQDGGWEYEIVGVMPVRDHQIAEVPMGALMIPSSCFPVSDAVQQKPNVEETMCRGQSKIDALFIYASNAEFLDVFGPINPEGQSSDEGSRRSKMTYYAKSTSAKARLLGSQTWTTADGRAADDYDDMSAELAVLTKPETPPVPSRNQLSKLAQDCAWKVFRGP
ncbi:hypothetical protein IWZ03DRAFT_357691 [Phyllosticta citriasiana]|uniref:Uncharacterized protein n=1 Tax=Phyllosticta citriasiana TaxID=595635 RepID=A0ABR1KVD8_9PEZI